MTASPRILVLGGTKLAREFANLVVQHVDNEVIYSLAGITRSPKLPSNVTVRYGGFGGRAAFEAYLKEQTIAAVVDATHPFAVTMSQTAIDICRHMDLPYLSLVPPAWSPHEQDHWTSVDSLDAAIAAIPSGSRVFLAIGRKYAERFLARADCWFLIRSIEPLAASLNAHNCCILVGSPAANADEEQKLLRAHSIDLVLSKNSGARSSFAKIKAARDLNLPVIMIERPQISAPYQVFTIHDAINWCKVQVSGQPSITL